MQYVITIIKGVSVIIAGCTEIHASSTRERVADGWCSTDWRHAFLQSSLLRSDSIGYGEIRSKIFSFTEA